MTEVPKESIIANTDFTITSGLAKRRLSSKKRKKQLEAHRHSGCGDSAHSDRSHSPSDSAYGSCQSVSSHPLTSPPHDRTTDTGQQLTSTSHTLSRSTILSHTSSSSFHPPTHSQPAPSSHTTELRNPGNCPPHATMPALAQNQYSNPVMLSQLQQELNYRFLSNGGKPQPEQTLPDQEAYSRKPIKWCNAHVSVAKMIQQHQLEAQIQAHPQPQSLPTSMEHTSYNTTQTGATLSAAQQQQLAVLQMYGVQPGGYMALPYSTMHEVPLVQFATLPQVNTSNNAAILKPGEQAILGLPSHPMQIAASGAGHMQHYAPAQMAVSNAGGLLMQGGGSWMTPVPMVGGNCVVNPLQAGILAAPWVK
ncbi:uncharacterized protein LOC135339300 isoform X2 [Halichondria panicea]